ncbi:VPDSG-CTERM sorting domain-containing protein [Pelagicoccus sp. NFK12]|uniref:VPDSG-CTERM sorting domain-containing protein n=1 Tax=Pelagicoccus enzymogenes TaxID=2773457 RepID=A0A927IGY2_9BACT|nr:VPDSG-CTERM sorting domain-containing protein [Pelagicoccus enzymogenes]MBD5778860.1 VPDSG-CTERM sorting domain-containing protein [Pelagicoccus enzymogenes]
MKAFSKFLSLLAVVGLASSAQAITIGNDAIDRTHGDGFSNFSMALLTEVVPAGGAYLTGWETYIEYGAQGNMALLFLEDKGSNNYEVKFVDERTVALGLNSFSASGALDAGWIMGIWMGTAKVSFDYVSGPDTTFTANGVLGSAPTVGQTVAYTGNITDRVYSINATVPDAGATISLLGIGLIGLAAVSRRKSR